MSLTAIVSAFEPEWRTLRHLVADARETRIAGTRYLTGTVAGRQVLAFLSGMGMVNAAMATERAIARFAPARILFSGVAGGLDPAIAVGDVVVPERWVQPLECVFARETPDGFAPPRDGPLACPSELPGFGGIFTRRIQVPSPEGVGYRDWFEANPELIAITREIAPGLSLRSEGQRHAVHIGGAGVSSPAFVDNAAYRDHLFANWGARVADMESAAVAQVAHAHGLPFVAFRSVSDLAGGGGGDNEWERFVHVASCNAAALVSALLERLS